MMKKLTPWKWFNRDPVTVEVEQPPEDNTPLPTIVLIHGAHQSNITFEYFRHALPGFRYINVDWSTTGGFHDNLDEMIVAIKDQGPVFLVVTAWVEFMQHTYHSM
jgi:hypothetical protein